ncbi:unnamed protein product [Lampetra fluviatilis]
MAKSQLVCRCGISVVVGEEAGTDDLSSVMFHGRSIPDAPTPRPPLSDDRACTATNPHYRALSTLSVDNAQLGFSLFWDWCGCTPFPMPPDRTCSGPRGPGHPSVSVSPERPSQPGRDALRLSWSPSPHRHHRLKGFQVTLLGLTGDMGRWTCWEVLLRKVPPDTQFLLTSHDLRLGVNYSITIQTLPPAGVDCPQNSHTTVNYHTRSETVSTFYFMSTYALSSNGPTSLFLFGSTASGQRAFTAITRFSSSTRWNNVPETK